MKEVVTGLWILVWVFLILFFIDQTADWMGPLALKVVQSVGQAWSGE